MSKKENTALILGANGLIGSELLLFLLKNNKYKTVYAVSRKPLAVTDPKLVNIIADQHSIHSHLQDLYIDHFYSCIGTTKNKTPNLQEYYKIDLDYPISVAKILKSNGCESINLVSSIGADSKSKNFYLKLKGDIEKACIDLNFASTHIYRPSILLGKRTEKRPLEKFSKITMKLVDVFLLGNLKNYKSIKAKTVASAMVNTALSYITGTHIYLTEEIKKNS